MAPDFARNITRTEAQLTTTAGGHNDFLAGGQLAWTWAVGMPYRVLADPQGMGVMPLSPADTVRRNEHGVPAGNFEQGLGYFAALQSFLTYSFGWTRHDRGLLWWHDNGQPVEDPRFALVKAIWDGDGMLLRYLAWCVERAVPAPSLGWLGEPLHRWASKVDHEPATLSPSWRERLARETAAAESAGSSFGEFSDEQVLERWAEGWGFNLGDINEFDALFSLVFAFLMPTIEELPNSLYKDVQQVRKGKRRPETLPYFTLRIDGAAVRHFLIETYDGPFDSEDSLLGAIMLRSAL